MNFSKNIFYLEDKYIFKIIDNKNIIINKYSIILKKKLYKFLLFLFLLYFFLYKFFFTKKAINNIGIKTYIKYIRDCKNHKKYKRVKIIKNNPYISICIPTLNMEKYIENALLSIINQSFQDFEIIVINDNSKDNTLNILKFFNLEDCRIKIINHLKNKGVYYSRVEAILNSKGKFIILMDPDDIFLNENLFQELYNYNLKNNLDIIEFKVFQQIEGRRRLIYPKKHYENHYHNFSDSIIYQPNLSKLLFKLPNTNEYHYSICRNIWNKMIRKKVFLYMIKYIGVEYFNSLVITSDDMVMNLIIYQFAKNYSNIDLPGYMYNIRAVSMSRGQGAKKLEKIRAINHILYFKILYKCIKEFNKSINIIYYEVKNLKRFIYDIKKFNISNYIYETKLLLNKILFENSHKKIKSFVTELYLKLEENKTNTD